MLPIEALLSLSITSAGFVLPFSHSLPSAIIVGSLSLKFQQNFIFSVFFSHEINIFRWKFFEPFCSVPCSFAGSNRRQACFRFCSVPVPNQLFLSLFFCFRGYTVVQQTLPLRILRSQTQLRASVHQTRTENNKKKQLDQKNGGKFENHTKVSCC